jgi:hypothetical protein
MSISAARMAKVRAFSSETPPFSGPKMRKEKQLSFPGAKKL